MQCIKATTQIMQQDVTHADILEFLHTLPHLIRASEHSAPFGNSDKVIAICTAAFFVDRIKGSDPHVFISREHLHLIDKLAAQDMGIFSLIVVVCDHQPTRHTNAIRIEGFSQTIKFILVPFDAFTDPLEGSHLIEQKVEIIARGRTD